MSTKDRRTAGVWYLVGGVVGGVVSAVLVLFLLVLATGLYGCCFPILDLGIYYIIFLSIGFVVGFVAGLVYVFIMRLFWGWLRGRGDK